MHLRFLLCTAVAPLLFADRARAAESIPAEVHGVVELSFAGPRQTAGDSPARDLDFAVRFRHESGAPEYTIPGYWDGDGRGGATGNVFKVRFCPTQPGRWTVAEVRSNAPALAKQHEGTAIVATASQHKGFWLVDSDSPGRRWYRRSNGAHDYIVGNTMYSFLSETYYGGRPNGSDVARDVRGNAAYFKKIRFSVPGDLYPHATVAPFLDDAGRPVYDGDFSHRPNPRWFRERVDVAVRTAFEADLITDLIMSGVDRVESRAAIRAAHNRGDPTPYFRYLVARYGAYPNVWFCLMNEYDIRTPRFTAEEIRDFGLRLRNLLVYPNPLSVHRASGQWPAGLNSSPAWNDHIIVQRKMKTIPAAADFLRESRAHGGGDKPVIDDELAYEGPGDRFSEEDVVEAHLGAFLAAAYGTTGLKSSTGKSGDPLAAKASSGLKPGEKLGQYFAGNFDAREHTAADNLQWMRDMIDRHITFWRMAPDESIFKNAAADSRGLAWPGQEYILGTNKARDGIVAMLPPGRWSVTRYDALAKSATPVATDARGAFAFAAPAGRAVFFHFKRR